MQISLVNISRISSLPLTRQRHICRNKSIICTIYNIYELNIYFLIQNKPHQNIHSRAQRVHKRVYTHTPCCRRSRRPEPDFLMLYILPPHSHFGTRTLSEPLRYTKPVPRTPKLSLSLTHHDDSFLIRRFSATKADVGPTKSGEQHIHTYRFVQHATSMKEFAPKSIEQRNDSSERNKRKCDNKYRDNTLWGVLNSINRSGSDSVVSHRLFIHVAACRIHSSDDKWKGNCWRLL